MPKIRELRSHEDFERMRIFTRPIVVFQEGELLDSGVIIESHDENKVTSTKNEHFRKSACQFYYGSK